MVHAVSLLKIVFVPELGFNAGAWQKQLQYLKDVADCSVYVPKGDRLEKIVDDLPETYSGAIHLVAHSSGDWGH